MQRRHSDFPPVLGAPGRARRAAYSALILSIPVPHMSFVWRVTVKFLRARYAALQQSSLFRGMRYSEDHAQIKEWAPLVMEGRDPQQKVAATHRKLVPM
ncbi:malate:quinone oxidoreductase [Escherichia coli]